MKMNYLQKNILLKLIAFLFVSKLFLNSYAVYAQQNNQSIIVKNFQDYTSNYREIVYCHLNKTTYLKGEMLGFSSYVIDKSLKTPSSTTKNLYCVITDENNQIIKKKLIKIDNGFSNNIFRIDSLFTSGKYTFKAYTNWMKNFDEPNSFIEKFTVMDPEKESFIKKEKAATILDVQFLPEGGHFVNNVKTNVGVIIKNSNGYGVPNIEGTIYTTSNKPITSFKTNFLGIGKFTFLPERNQTYTVKINHLKKQFEYTIADIKREGISICLNQSNTKIALELNTNSETLKNIKNKNFKLTIHNGSIIKEAIVKFKKTTFIKTVNYKDLLPGINIFTLFDDKNTPILERMFFNFNGITTINLKEPSYTQTGDSIHVTIGISSPHHNLIKEERHVSISVLPESTKSYDKNQNILSYTYLQPYLKGYIENAAYYFNNIDRKKKYELDNLLITQGWSSYNWNTIFNNKPISSFSFEKGVIVKVNKNNLTNSTFFISPLQEGAGSLINLPQNKKSFTETELYPQDEEQLTLSVLNEKGKLIKPNLYLQFYPNKIPTFNTYFSFITPPKEEVFTTEIKANPFTDFELNKQQNLEEVVVTTNLERKRIDKLQSKSWGDVYLVEDSFRKANLTLANYINAYIPGFYANEYMGNFILSTNSTVSFNGNATPIVYVDDMIQTSFDFLYHYNMYDVDYIVANRHGLGEGVRGANGVLKIYTLKSYGSKKSIDNNRKFDFPLTFSSNKKFYTPKYKTYHNTFYKEYGVVDWIPNCKIDANGNLSFTIYNPSNSNLKLFIEGITQKGEYIVENKTLNINSNQ